MEKMPDVSLGSKVPHELKEEFDSLYEQHNRPQKGRMLTAMVKTFLRLPYDLQARLLSNPEAEDSLETIVRQLVDKRIDERLPAAPQTLEEGIESVRRAAAALPAMEMTDFIKVIEAVLRENKHKGHRFGPIFALAKRVISEHYSADPLEFTLCEKANFGLLKQAVNNLPADKVNLDDVQAQIDEDFERPTDKSAQEASQASDHKAP